MLTRILPLILTLALASLSFARHPANIPVARAKIAPDGSVDLKVRFDMLAFILETLPEDTANAPMDALIDGPPGELQRQLDAAEVRFRKGTTAIGESGAGTVDSVSFPTAKDIAKYVDDNPDARLPVMMTVSVTCHLPKGAETSSFRFPETLGAVVLTTEFPYTEPISESVELGLASIPRQIPTQKEIDAAAAAIDANNRKRDDPTPLPSTSEREVRGQIQTRYDAWSSAYMKNDVEMLLSILAPDYSLKMSNGNVLTHDEYEVVLNQRRKKGLDTTQYSTQILDVTLHEGVAAIWSRETTVVKQKSPETHKVEDVQYQHDYIDVWTFAKGKWLLRSTATRRETSKIKPPTTLPWVSRLLQAHGVE